jgi:hypothetical protein
MMMHIFMVHGVDPLVEEVVNKWCSKLRKTLPIIVAQPEETPQLCHVPGCWPTKNGPDLLLMYLYPLCIDDVTQVK